MSLQETPQVVNGTAFLRLERRCLVDLGHRIERVFAVGTWLGCVNLVLRIRSLHAKLESSYYRFRRVYRDILAVVFVIDYVDLFERVKKGAESLDTARVVDWESVS